MPEPLTVGVIFAGSLVLVLVRPRRVPDWSAALGGGLLMILAGVWTLDQALRQLAESSDVFLFFVGLGVASATADRAGLFDAAAHIAAATARGSQRRLLVGLFAVSTVVTAVLSNDATALLLTPVAFAAASRLGLNPLGWPLGRVALVGAVVLVVLDTLVAGWQPMRAVRDIPWSLLGLVAGLFLLVGGAEQASLFASLVGAIDAASAVGSAGLAALVIGMALMANLINNLPSAMLAASALSILPATVERSNLVAATIIGVNLKPNLTTIGSLATMLWLVLLRRRGLEVSALDYVRVGGLVTVPALALATQGLNCA